jgi:hypothetical protein
MNQKEPNAWMERALGLVPKGDPCQSRFRVALNIVFRNALGPKPARPGTQSRRYSGCAAPRERGYGPADG